MDFTNYFRTSLIDAERYATKFNEIEESASLVSLDELAEGRLSADTVNAIFEDEEKSSVDILINPIIIQKKNAGRIAPLWIPATLHSTGNISPHKRDLPWVSVYYLAPSRTGEVSIGYLKDYEEAYQNHDLSFEAWSDCWNFAEELFGDITGHTFEAYRNDHYEKWKYAAISKKQRNLREKEDLVHVLEDVSKRESHELPLTYRRFTALEPTKKEEFSFKESFTSSHDRHIGHFTGSDALTSSQRQALYHFFEEKKGSFLAVNGPPGTGKSMLLTCIAASLFVESAVEQRTAPPTIAVTAHDQFTTHDLTDDFHNAPGSLLEKRWIPHFGNYALYLSSSKEEGMECFCEVNRTLKQPNFLDEARSVFLEKAGSYAGHDFTSIEGVAELLHEKLCTIVNEMRQAFRILENGSDEEIVNWLKERNVNRHTRDAMASTLDLRYRRQAFSLAARYWEARWLNSEHDWSKNSLYEKVKSLNKLYPVVTAPVYQLPKYFSSSENDIVPVYESMDLLMIEESGQMLPEMAAAVIPFSKQVVAIGDIHQVKPLWNSTKTFDVANMVNYGWNEEEDPRVLFDSGRAASKGSMLRVCQHLSRYQVHPDVDGMFLTEHRRCVPEVINYCNELIYQSWLKPIRSSYESYPYPHIGLSDVKGEVTRYESGMSNQEEAAAVIEWIREHREKLLSFYNKDEISEVVSIVTPFSEQMELIQEYLELEKIKDLTVGTIHMMQGASSPVILFSSVYREGEAEKLDFDEDKTLLNVAVSRAKDCFMIIGDERLFDEEGNSPSSLLKKHVLIQRKSFN
ncbi:DEAD/DEAH box helicase [Halobacillus salinus]|uniref:DNA2/NAM7 helicase-like C-terminal domain-containing protein n=1 Tax=Halobacillus salinus TaxID=192814 RepID=A0A4Z0H6X2_9BACI|nr:DEAD/DEAH box helicase [Halobacillus salinus]TGB04866.1 hypothetical protein E4663_07690 [Halobacillus salinus]